MKKSMIAVMLVLLFASGVYAQQTFIPKGSAVVPGIHTLNLGAVNYGKAELYITNISNTTVQCKVTVFDHDGMDISSKCRIFTGTYDGTQTPLIGSGGGPFDLPAGNTRLASIYIGSITGRNIYGHAVIEWGSSDVALRKALVASLRTWARGGASDSGFGAATIINGGQPF